MMEFILTILFAGSGIVLVLIIGVARVAQKIDETKEKR